MAPALPPASPMWATAVPMEFAPSAALTAGIVPHPLLLCLPDTWREKERRVQPLSLRHGVNSLAGVYEVEELSIAPCGDLGLPPQGPWAFCPPRLTGHEGWSLGLNFLPPPLLMIWDRHLRFLRCLGMDDAPHFISDLPALKFSVPTWIAVFAGDPLHLFLGETFCRGSFIFCFLSWKETEGNTNSTPCHVTSLCKEAYLLLFDLRPTTPEVNDYH